MKSSKTKTSQHQEEAIEIAKYKDFTKWTTKRLKEIKVELEKAKPKTQERAWLLGKVAMLSETVRFITGDSGGELAN